MKFKYLISRCCCICGAGLAAVGAMGLDTVENNGFFMAFALTMTGLAIAGSGLLINKAGSRTRAHDKGWEGNPPSTDRRPQTSSADLHTGKFTGGRTA